MTEPAYAIEGILCELDGTPLYHFPLPAEKLGEGETDHFIFKGEAFARAVFAATTGEDFREVGGVLKLSLVKFWGDIMDGPPKDLVVLDQKTVNLQ